MCPANTNDTHQIDGLGMTPLQENADIPRGFFDPTSGRIAQEQDVDVSVAPTNNQGLVWVAGTSKWTPGNVGLLGVINTWTALNTFTGGARNAGAPSVGADLTNKTYVDAQDALAVHLAGNETLTGTKTFTMGSVGATDIACTITGDLHSRLQIMAGGNLQWGDGASDVDVEFRRIGAGVVGVAGAHKLSMAAAPTAASDVANKAYVDQYNLSTQTVGANTLLDGTKNVTVVNSNTGVWTITLPATIVPGMRLTVKDIGNAAVNNITISGNGHTIDGDATKTINAAFGAIQVMGLADASAWVVLAPAGRSGQW